MTCFPEIYTDKTTDELIYINGENVLLQLIIGFIRQNVNASVYYDIDL